MSVRINLEIGHEASIRAKKTQEGFTHDWEVFVRGCDGANISFYVEKVVFHLHDTFPKPKRVVKSPPYSVKETGYAGFPLPIDIYLRNKDEPKKIRFNYILDLQQAGPPMLRSQKEKYIFSSPSEEFKANLLKGGGIIVNTTNFHESRENRPVVEEKSQLISKPRLSGADLLKKHKPKVEEPRISNSFNDLFGPPITKITKVSSDPKPSSKDKNSNVNKAEKGSDRPDKLKSKHSPHKEKEKERDRDKFRDKDVDKKLKDDKKREERKERSKDREDRSKDRKERREKSPKAKSPSPKRSSSPKRYPSPPAKYKEEKKALEFVNKDRKNVEEKDKFEKKLKKEKRDKEKDKKENKHKDKGHQKSFELKENKNVIKEKEKEKIKEPEMIVPPKIEKRDTIIKEKEFVKELKDEVDRNGQIKQDKIEERPKHKHKKKDKERKREKNEGREKNHKAEKKLEKSSTITSKENDKSSLFNSPKNPPSETKQFDKSKKPLDTLLQELNDASGDSLSSPEDLFSENVSKNESSKELFAESVKTEQEKVKIKKDKTKKNKEKRGDKDSEKKRKRKLEEKDDEPMEKISKADVTPANVQKESDSDHNDTQLTVDKDKENGEESSEAYMNVLRGLQQKIMTLQDNAELQKVVQLIAETGKFEVTTQTFDFDLCLLDRSTINQLRQFFDGTS